MRAKVLTGFTNNGLLLNDTKSLLIESSLTFSKSYRKIVNYSINYSYQISSQQPFGSFTFMFLAACAAQKQQQQHHNHRLQLFE